MTDHSFVILDTIGDVKVVGTGKGHAGIMSQFIMDDLGLVPSTNQGMMVLLTKYPPAGQYRHAMFPIKPIWIDDLENDHRTITPAIETIQLQLWAFMGHYVYLGWGEYSHIWVVSPANN